MERAGAGNKERPLSPPVKHMKQKEHMKQSPPCETTCNTDHCVSNWTDPVLRNPTIYVIESDVHIIRLLNVSIRPSLVQRTDVGILRIYKCA